MRAIIGAVAVGAVVVGGGAVLASRHSIDSQMDRAPAPTAVAPIATSPTAPAAVPAIMDGTVHPQATLIAATTTTTTAHRRVVYRRRTRYVTHTRSGKHSAEIIGGSAVGGALVGGLVGGGKGALVGGLVGGAAGTVYDRKTRHKVRPQ
ncbi:MAG: hypothetical protein DMF82_08970 [Acidobacteria bacterium]|nr:MAG: hypothetical protein DMF82_08970 [Acidobacteriota bacterium]